MTFREKIKELAPRTALNFYRKVKNANHYVFKRFKDARSARKYNILILDRFPDVENNTEKSDVLDLGANIGSFNQACVDLGMSVKSVEPQTIAFKYLHNRTKRFSEVWLYQMAVSDRSGILKLFTHPHQQNDPITASVSATLVIDKFRNHDDHYEVPTVTLDTFFEDGSVYEIVKIDIEGAEMYLVDQLIANSKNIKRLLVETHERFMKESKSSYEYETQLKKLSDFIAVNKLDKVWLLDWI